MASNAAPNRPSQGKSAADRIKSPAGRPTDGLKLTDIRKAVRVAFENRELKHQRG